MKPMGGGAASAADFYASQTRQSGAPAERLSLEPTHATTGKRQMQVASAPNSIARVRCIFERFAVESDGQKVLTEEAFAAYTREVGAVRPAVPGGEEASDADLAKRYKLICATFKATPAVGMRMQELRALYRDGSYGNARHPDPPLLRLTLWPFLRTLVLVGDGYS